jgi:hypothetical protein
MVEKNAEELRESLNEWLDNMMEVYGSVREEWEENDVVQPFPNAKISFHCTDCGNCCDFTDRQFGLIQLIWLLDTITYKEKTSHFLRISSSSRSEDIGYGPHRKR